MQALRSDCETGPLMLTLRETDTEQAHLLVKPRSRVKTTLHPRMAWLGFATGLEQKPRSPGLVLPPRFKVPRGSRQWLALLQPLARP